MKFAVIDTSGTQFRVEENQPIQVDRLALEKGKEIVFDKVNLFVDGKQVLVGKPYVAHCEVVGEVTDHTKGVKIRVAKFKAKAHYRKVRGFRHQYSSVLIKKIAYGKN